MKRFLSYCLLSLAATTIILLGIMKPVQAYMTEDEVWGNYTYALVRGSWRKIGFPYYSIHHEARIFECIKGRCHFKGMDQSGNTIYSVYYLLGIWSGTVYPLEKIYDPPYYWQVWTALTETWGAIGTPYQERVCAFIGPPGTV